jgi:hypothetical protein
MSEQSGAIYLPPFENVRLVECRDFMALVPICAYRQFVGYGKISVRDIPVREEKSMLAAMVASCPADEEAWVVVEWKQFEDGHEEEGLINYLFAGATEEDARKSAEGMMGFKNESKEEILALLSCYEATEEDYAYVESHYPNLQGPVAGPGAIEANDLYQARLKVLAGLQPKTVNLVQRADEAEDLDERHKLEREAVDAYFAELAPAWTEDEVLAWQRNNPIGTEWLCEYGRVLREPERKIDPINYELAFRWLHRKYNLLTAEELSDKILIATGQRVMPGALKKRRERLGLTTKRPPGPPPRESQ